MSLEQIRARAEAATEGPWEAYDANEGEWPPRPMWCVANDAFHNPPADEDAPWLAVEVHTGVKEDAEFIAHARTDIPRLLNALDAVLALHKPVKKWEPYEGAGYTFATREEALRAAGEEDLGVVAIEAGPQFFEVCGECGRIEGEQLSEAGEEWGYRESLWPCPTMKAITDALEVKP